MIRAPGSFVEQACEMAGGRGRLPGMTDDAARILAADLLDDADAAVEGTLRPRSLDEYIGQREVKANLSVLLDGRAGQGRGRRPRPPLRPARPRQDDPRHDHRPRARRQRPLHERPGGRAGRRPRRDPHRARRARRPVHRRDPPPQPGGRGDPLPGDGGLRARRDDRQGPVGAVAAADASSRSRSSARRPAPAGSRAPLRDRFGATYRLDFYEEADLTAIVERSARILGVEIDAAAPRRDRPARARHAADREPAAQAGPRPRPGPRRRPGRRGDRRRGDAGAGDRRRRPRLHRPQAPGRDHPEVRPRARSAWRRSPPSCPRRSRRSRTSTSRSCSGSGSSIGRRRAGSPTEAGRGHLARLGYEIPPPRRPEPEIAGALGWTPALEPAEEPS